MRGCDQELCAYWTGNGCACSLLDIERPEGFGDRIVGSIEAFTEVLVTIPPFSWFDTILTGSVGPRR